MKMASSQVEIVSSSTLICGPKDRNRQEICRDNNGRGTQTVFENNLKVLVRDHLTNCSNPADSGNCSKIRDQNNHQTIEDSNLRSKTRVIDYRSEKSGQSNNQKQDSQNPNRSDENSPASSLVQMWEARLHQPIANPNQTSNNRTNGGSSVSETHPPDSSSNAEISTSEPVDDNNIEKQISNGDEMDWDLQSDVTSVSETAERANSVSGSGSVDEERVRIVDIIRRLSSDPDQVNSSPGSVQEQAVVPCTPRIRGRQAFADLLLQMERSRKKELFSLAERHAVSKFPQRGRLQSMLKIRCLQRCVAIQGRNRPKPVVPDQSRNGLIRLREKPKTGLENGAEGRTEATNVKNQEDSRTFSNGEQRRAFRNNDKSTLNAESKCVLAQDATEKSIEKIVSGKMKKASITEIDEKIVPKNFSEKGNSRKIGEKPTSDSREDGKRVVSRENSREIDENLFLRKNLEKCGLLEAAMKSVGRENLEKAVMVDAEKANSREAKEKMIFRENVDSGRSTEKSVFKQIGEKTVVKENSGREIGERTVSGEIAEKSDSRQTAEKTISRETAEKEIIGETVKKNDACQIGERMNFRKATDKTNSREIAEKANSRETSEKVVIRETKEKTDSREIAKENSLGKVSEKAIAEEIVQRKGDTHSAEKTRSDETASKSLTKIQKSVSETVPCKDSSDHETKKQDKKITNQTSGIDEPSKKEKYRKDESGSEGIAEAATSRNSLEKNQTQECLESKTLFDSDRNRFLEGEETDLLKGWDGNEEDEEEDLEEYSDDRSYYAENIGYDWFSDISRPRSYWEDIRKQWYIEVLNTDSEKDEIRQLLQRQTVANFLSSDLRDKIDRLMISRTQRPVNTGRKQEKEEEGEKERWEELETDRERDCGIAVDATNENAEYHEASSDRLSQSSSSLTSGTSLMRSWSYHDQEAADDRDQDVSASASPAAQSSRSAFPATHAAPVTMEMQLLCDLRSQMEQLQREVSEMKNSMKSCSDSQLNMQTSISHDSNSGGVSESMLGRKCCVCLEKPVNSLLYRCGHMCTCLKCANELQWSSGKCPKCMAPIVDVVRAFL